MKAREANKERMVLRRQGEAPVDVLFAEGGERALLGLDVGNLRRQTEFVSADLLAQVGDGHEVHLIRWDVGDAKNHRNSLAPRAGRDRPLARTAVSGTQAAPATYEG